MSVFPGLSSVLAAPELLHIPDGFLSTPVALVGWLVAITLIGVALYQTRGQLGEKQIPLMGVVAAFIFAAQAINVPIGGGTSGHLLGGALAAIILGPWAAVLVMTAVISVQALLFQDGGVLVLGWNIINMGILTAFTGYAVYNALKSLLGNTRTAVLVAGGIGGWLSMMVGAAATAVEIALSGTSPLAIAMPAMLSVHAVLGLIEAFITVGALAFMSAARPDLLDIGATAPARASAGWVAGGIGIALGVATLSPLASPNPDGLERVAEDVGFLDTALEPAYKLLPDYTIPGVENGVISGIIAVMLGTVIVFGLSYFVGRILGARRRTATR
jgi:cobalt/nickel transport system permease protein